MLPLIISHPFPCQVGETLGGGGGFSLALVASENVGVFDVDVFNLKIDGLLDLSVRMRVANPMLQSPTDAEAHFNIAVNDIQVRHTDSVIFTDYVHICITYIYAHAWSPLD